jgi:hypothetical protein
LLLSISIAATLTTFGPLPVALAGSGTLVADSPNKLSIYFNFRFEPTQSEIADAKVILQETSELLCDATDGQMVIDTVRMTTGRTSEDAANIWYLAQEGRSFVSFWFDGSGLEASGSHINLFNDDLTAEVVAHELGHHAFGLGDEYREQCRFETGCGVGACLDGNTDSQNNCLMQQTQPDFSEFCVAGNHDAVQGETGPDDGICGIPECAADQCTDDNCSERWNSETGEFEVSQQEIIHGASCWETITDNYPFFQIPGAGLPTAAAPDACSAAVDFRELIGGTEQVYLVIDRSGSMSARAGRAVAFVG